jgi:hypothetical protein
MVLLPVGFEAFLALLFKIRGTFGKVGLDLQTVLELLVELQTLFVESFVVLPRLPEDGLVAVEVGQHGFAVESGKDLGSDVGLITLDQLLVDAELVGSEGRLVVLDEGLLEVLGALKDELVETLRPLLHDIPPQIKLCFFSSSHTYSPQNDPNIHTQKKG